MNYYITNIKDSVGNNYLGIKIYPHVVSNFLNDLKDYLDEEYDDYVNNQKRRDDNSYHITIINVMDYNLLSKSMGVTKFIEFIDRLFEYPIDDLKFFERTINLVDNPLYEIYKLFNQDPRCIYWIREFGVIQGDEVVRDRLEEVYHTLGISIPKNIELNIYLHDNFRSTQSMYEISYQKLYYQ